MELWRMRCREEANSNSGQITTDKGDFPFVCFVCRINVLEAVETIQAHYGCYFTLSFTHVLEYCQEWGSGVN